MGGVGVKERSEKKDVNRVTLNEIIKNKIIIIIIKITVESLQCSL